MRKISIIIPARNEENNIASLLERIHSALSKNKIEYEIIVVDDFSTDGTARKVRSLEAFYPLKLHKKQGKAGKAFSIIEGARVAKYPHLLMIDADLQYAPEAIPGMVEAEAFDVVIAERKKYKSSLLRKIGSKLNSFLFGRLLFGLNNDIQSGLKLFPKHIVEHLDLRVIGPWSLDIPLLFVAREMGLSIGSVQIDFEKRLHGQSKIRFFHATFEIVLRAIRLRLVRRKIYSVNPDSSQSPRGAGLAYKGRKYITHTTLSYKESALNTFTLLQLFILSFIIGLLGGGLYLDATLTAIITVGLLSFVYFLDVLFSLFLTARSLRNPPEIRISNSEIGELKDSQLPLYTILCPLFKEGHIVPQFLEALGKLNWPKEKLEVLLLLEEEDESTIEAVSKMTLPGYVKVVIVPESVPKTKPKACNFGLTIARGEYTVIFDAEDKPEPLQLKKAYLAFLKSSKSIICLQAKLNYYNPHQNLLTRLFTAEYSLWFDLTLPGLQSIGTTIPLGGTSNHFRTQDLLRLEGWDPFNVTEDCDLGVRIFRKGYKTAIIDSVTYEEANSRIINWFRQRSRWIKGYMQTFLVHMRNPVSLIQSQGKHAFIFQLVVGGKIAFMLINPLLWTLTVSYFALYAVVGPAIETVYPGPVFYIAVLSLVFGNFLYLYNYMIGCAKREQWAMMKYVFLIPFYWLMVSISAFLALFQLIFNPHYWEKTHHGFHLGTVKEALPTKEDEKIPLGRIAFRPNFAFLKILSSPGFIGGMFLILSMGVSNFFNFLYNAYLGRMINIEDYGLVSVFSSFVYLSQVPLGALSKTITYRSAYLLGKFNLPVKAFWADIENKSFTLSIIVAGFWMMSIPLMLRFFHLTTLLPFIIFTPIWIVGTSVAVNNGFLTGSMKFFSLAAIALLETSSKLLLAFIFIKLGLHEFVYASVPLSMIISFVISIVAIQKIPFKKVEAEKKSELYFPKRFFSTSFLTSISQAAFLTFDVILAKHYLSSVEAGQYALLSLSGKMIFFVSGLFSQFINPKVSRDEGAGNDSRKSFYYLLAGSVLMSFAGFVVLGMYGKTTSVMLFGPKTLPIIPLLPKYCLGIAYFSIAMTIVTFHQSRREYLFPVIGTLLTAAEFMFILFFHNSLETFTSVVLLSGVANLLFISLLHLFYQPIVDVINNTLDLFDLLKTYREPVNDLGKLRILIFNWRDTRHVWAGGAEVYIHEIAKRWVSTGHHVTVFCGNDARHKRNQIVDGVEIVRRGGFYTVYVWAVLYYLLRFRGKFNVIIDSQNGVPFFTPLFVRKPKFLLIHHIHQDVFRDHLRFPLSKIAMFIESTLMPLVYKNEKIITVSQSSKAEIIKLGLFKKENIYVISPGIDSKNFELLPKTSYPSFLYLGRLKRYKNVDVIIKAFAQILGENKTAQMKIAGEGESMAELKKLANSLGISSAVEFLGKVTEARKVELLATSWVALQPSSIEGWGITVIEANASGTPVIAANVNGLKDSVLNGKTGVLVPVKHVTAFSQAMDSVISKTGLRNNLSRQAIKWSQEFEWDKSADNFLRLIQLEVGGNTRFPFIGKLAVTNT